MEKKSDTYQIATDIQWGYAGNGIVRQIMGYDEHLMMVKVKFNQGAIAEDAAMSVGSFFKEES